MQASGSGVEVLAAMRVLVPQIRACSEAIEQNRELPRDLVRELAAAGVFRMLVPLALGGLEVDPATAVALIEEAARADGATGWCVMIGGTSGLQSGYLPEEQARAIYGSDPLTVTGGALALSGRAVAVEGGYRVSGRWAFGSGSRHCDWLSAGCVVFDGDAPRLTANKTPEMRTVMLAAAQCEIIDTWHVSGLRGTGSHDFLVRDQFVPQSRAMALFDGRPLRPERLFDFPFLGILAATVAAVALGIGRHAIEALVELAGAKTPAWNRKLLRERPLAQMQVGQAEASLRAGRAFLLETVDEIWQSVLAGRLVTLEQRAVLRLAATKATLLAVEATDLMYHAGGATALYDSSPLQRCFRDIHAVTQHITVSQTMFETAGRLALGTEADTTLL